jgi:hypothetical protein
MPRYDVTSKIRQAPPQVSQVGQETGLEEFGLDPGEARAEGGAA